MLPACHSYSLPAPLPAFWALGPSRAAVKCPAPGHPGSCATRSNAGDGRGGCRLQVQSTSADQLGAGLLSCQQPAPAQPAAAVLLLGFWPDEVAALAEYLDEVYAVTSEAPCLLPVSQALLDTPLATAAATVPPATHAAAQPSALHWETGRVAMLLGEPPEGWGAFMGACEALGLPPALYGLPDAGHLATYSVRQFAGHLRRASAAQARLWQPLAVDAGQARVPRGVSLAMNLVLEHAEVPQPHERAPRQDASHVVVLDGLCTEAERGALLDWLTAPGWDHAQGPPEDKWERGCVDADDPRVRATWGLRPHLVAALRDDPPPPVVALQSRLAALYPEFDIGFLPAEALESGGVQDEAAPPLSVLVGNAAEAGDTFSWHQDADPAASPAPDSPWAAHWGFYYNRQAGHPLFVSMMVYLNADWPQDLDAETMFLDPASGTGVFVRPAPGRVVLMDQDVPHRVSAPSIHAGMPRYSLVWKLVFYPKEDAAINTIARPEWGEPVRFGSCACLPTPLDEMQQAHLEKHFA